MAISTEDMVTASADLLQRSGVGELRVGHSDPDDGEPVMWYAMAFFRTADVWEAAGAMSLARAMFRLCERVCDGGTCQHCGRPTGVVDNARAADMPLTEMMCWYAYDAELRTFRRACEGVAP